MPRSNTADTKSVFNEEFSRGVLNSMTAHIAVLDHRGRIIAVNDAWTRFALDNGEPSADPIGIGANYLGVCRRAEARGDTSAAQARLGIEAVLRGAREQFVLEYPCHSPDQQRWFLLKATPIRHFAGAVVAHEDITSRRIAEERLQQSNALLELRVGERTAELERLNTALQAELADRQEAEKQLRQAATVFDNTNEAIMVTNARHEVVSVNPAFTQITGYASAEVVGKHADFQLSGRHTATFFHHMSQGLAHRGQWQGEIWNRRRNGEVYPAWESISTVKDSSGEIINYVTVFSDISEIKEVEAQLAELAHHDQLTGLANRLLFSARLEQAIERAKRHHCRVALLFLDLDRFKMVNDTLGHAAGDRLLQRVADRLRECVRSEDTVARLGGDEFTVILEDVEHAQDAAILAHKLNHALSEEIDVEGFRLRTSGSIGIGIYPDDAQEGSDLLRAADSAMYSAKDRGRNTYQFYRSELTDRAFQRLSIENDLRRALPAGELGMHYQPQICPATGHLFGIEALIRWEHPTLGMVMPEQFIGIAEESGLIHQVDEWVLRTVLGQIRQWRDEGLAIPRVAINISGREVLHNHLGDRVRGALEDMGVDPSEVPLELEITESVLQRSDPTLDILHGLREL
ncbi:MAG: diguanylate cyclase, partial [Chromatiales bacterium]